MAYTFAQSPVVANGTGSSISKAFASNTTAHSLLVAVVTTDASSPGTFTFTGGGTWSSLTAKFNGTIGQWITIGYCLDATGGSAPTIQASWTGSGSFNGIMVAEFTNGGVASLLDTNTASSTGTSTAPTDSAMSATAADVVVSYVILGGSATISAGATFTIPPNGQDATDLAAWEYKILGGSGSTTPVFSLTGSVLWFIYSAAFKPAGGAAAAPAPLPFAPGKTWRRRYKHPQRLYQGLVAAAATNPTADVANGTGAASNPSPSIAPVTTTATATGVANNATVKISPTPTSATSAGTADNPSPSIKVNAGLASATGTADNPTVNTGGAATNANAGLASGTGTAYNPSPAIAPVPGFGSGTGLANNTTSKVSPTPTTGTASGVAFNPTVLTGSLALAGNASGTGVANNTTSKIAPVVGTASAAGVANNPTVVTGGATNAPAGLASGTGTANNPTVTIGKTASAGLATATGAASNPSLSIRATAGLAAAVAAAFNPTIPAAVIDVTGRATVTQTVASTVDVGGPSSMAGVTQTVTSTASGTAAAGGSTRADPTIDGRAEVG